MRGCALFLVFVLPALLLGAPAPSVKSELPTEAIVWIKSCREFVDGKIDRTRMLMKRPDQAKRQGYHLEQIRIYERRFYDEVLVGLQNLRAHPLYSGKRRIFSPEERRGLDIAIKEYSRLLNKAVRTGEASANRQVAPALPSEAYLHIMNLSDESAARVRRAKDGLKQPRDTKHQAALEEECRHAERWYYDKALAYLQSLLDDPDGALQSKKLDDDDKSAVKDMIQRFERMRDAAVRSGAASDKPQFVPPPKKK